MRQSNGYTIGFTVALTVVCAFALAMVKSVLTEDHVKNDEIDTKSKVLGAMIRIDKSQVLDAFGEKIEGVIVNNKGEVITPLDEKGDTIKAEDVDIKKQFQEKDPAKKFLPVFKLKSDVYEGQFEAYILPMQGNGLWDAVYGFIAVDPDGSTILGVQFDHKGETPGLGARIKDDAGFPGRFVGKQIFNEAGELKSVTIMKGEGANYDDDPHKVDGLSGASMTTQGVNDMLKANFELYKNYFAKLKEEGNSAGAGEELKIDRNIF